MAGLEGLASIIYHEKQQPGSALCGQHALNNLLQGNYFSTPDLSDIAANLDLLERSYRGEGSVNGNDSTNMDDTGFFSIQVIENALKVWGLNLVRWRSEELSRYHDRPHVQLAFILNLEQHWFTLRRFGNAEATVDIDPGHGHWFNLNSFLKSPEWVGRVYLGMVLEQAEQEGYSVFAVVQADPSAPVALPRTDADIIAATLPEPSGASSSYTSQMFHDDKNADEGPDGFEEEDLELQAALQASLGGYDYHSHRNNEETMTYESGPSDTRRVSEQSSELRNADPVASSMERNRLMLQRMRQQQEYAQREAWSYTTEGMTPEQIAEQEARREARRKQEEEEEEHLRRAIAESEAMARRSNQTGGNAGDGFSEGQSQNLHDDDDDAELQAALRASLGQANGISTFHTGQVDSAPVSESHHDVSSVPSGGLNSAEPSEVPTIEEMRRKRLAKFGA